MILDSTSRRGVPLAILIVLAVAGMLCGCGGGATSAAKTTPDDTAPVAQIVTELPAPGTYARDASMIETPLRCRGSQCRLDTLAQNVAIDGDECVFTPDPIASDSFTIPEAAIAMYDFDLDAMGGANTPFAVQVSTTDDGSGGGGGGALRVFAGIGNPDRNIWQWVELTQGALSWSWGVSNSNAGTYGGGMGAGRINPWQPVAIVVFGEGELRVSQVELLPNTEPLAAGAPVIRKGWDGTIKGSTKFDGSCDVERDGSGQLHFSYYDSSNGQLYHSWLHGRLWTTQAVDCDGDAGLTHDLANVPDGGLLLAYAMDGSSGVYKHLPLESIESGIWSPRSNFEAGLDEGGLTIDAGSHSSVVCDAEGVPHIFYEDQTNNRIRHAWKPLGAMEWLHEYVSPEGHFASGPVGLLHGTEVMCVYMQDSSLFVARPEAMTWACYELDDVMYNPKEISAVNGFCDAAVHGNYLTTVHTTETGLKVNVQDITSVGPPPRVKSKSIARSGGGVYVEMAQMGDGSVRLAHYCIEDKLVYFETGDVPTQEQFEFVSTPAVQIRGDEDCDDLCFWVAPDEDGDAGHDAALGVLSSRLMPGSGERKKEFKGHVTLLK